MRAMLFWLDSPFDRATDLHYGTAQILAWTGCGGASLVCWLRGAIADLLDSWRVRRWLW